MKKHTGSLHGIFTIAIILLIGLAGPAIVFGGISEPDHILYGTVSANQRLYTSGKVSLKLGGIILAEGEITSDTGADRYIIRIPMDCSYPQSPESARTGETVKIYFNTSGYLMGQLTIGEKGEVSELNFTIPDMDNDGLSDADELEAQTFKDNPDSDGDGLLDGWEKQYGFDPVATDNSSQDGDFDGLSNLEEQASGTSPLLADSDKDGCEDGIELAGRRNPLVPDPFGDINQDCIIDLKDINLSLEIMSLGSDSPQTGHMADVNEDGIIDLTEAFLAVQKNAELRNDTPE